MTMKRMLLRSKMTTKKNKLHGLAFLALTLSFVAAPATLLLDAAPAVAQQRGPAQRVVEGIVEGSGQTHIPGAIVYLKNTKTLAVKSFVSDDGGKFRFVQLSPDTDYEVWAEKDGKKSPVKTVSQWDERKEFESDLKLK